jgi:hypothetical protein
MKTAATKKKVPHRKKVAARSTAHHAPHVQSKPTKSTLATAGQLTAGLCLAAAAAMTGVFVSLNTAMQPELEMATQGTPFISQPYDPRRLVGINAYDPKQSELTTIMQRALHNHNLTNAKVTVAAWEPRILIVDDFLSSDETDHMVKVQGRRFGSTAVVTTDGGAEVLPNTVTSKIGYYPEGDQIVKRVNKRISDLSFIPIPWGEPLHAIHYDPGQYFRGHLDVHAAPGRPTSSRVATCFIYMSDVESGGETYFPMAKKADGGWGAHSFIFNSV